MWKNLSMHGTIDYCLLGNAKYCYFLIYIRHLKTKTLNVVDIWDAKYMFSMSLFCPVGPLCAINILYKLITKSNFSSTYLVLKPKNVAEHCLLCFGERNYFI